MDGWMDGWMDGCTYESLHGGRVIQKWSMADGQASEREDGWTCGLMEARTELRQIRSSRRTRGWMYGCTDESLHGGRMDVRGDTEVRSGARGEREDGWMDGWMDGCMDESLHGGHVD